jgi:SAM-dependent methyltransferase
MPTGDDVPRLESERRDADSRYNEALTALDRTVAALAAQPAPSRGEFARLATVLIVFLQQITAFVETKDRELAATTALRFEAIERKLESVAELGPQVSLLQRALQAMTRQRSSFGPRVSGGETESHDSGLSPTGSPGPPPAGDDAQSWSHSYKYVGFEDQFRGPDDEITERLRGYVPIFVSTADVLDLGCGRGELLAALRAAGVSARGVDANGEMAAIARDRGLDASQGDALEYVESLPDSSLGGVIATQVVEHLEPAYLMRLLDALFHKMRPGAPIVLETINPACWLAFFSSYMRDFTHVWPVHPETLQFLLRASGFERVRIQYSAPVPDQMKMKTIDLPSRTLAENDPVSLALTGLAHTVNSNAVILNNLMFTHLDYAAIGYRV